MACQEDDAFFARLISPILDQLHRIARTTQGEYSVDELKTEAWIAAEDYRRERGVDVAPDDEDLQRTVIIGLWRAFGEFANRTLRAALRLDRETIGENGELAINAMAATLAAPACYEPENVFERSQKQAENARYLAECFTEAVAWLRVLDCFDHDTSSIARYLAISPRTLDARLKHAQIQAACQPSIFDGIAALPDNFSPQRVPHRSKRCSRQPFRRVCVAMRPWQMHMFSTAGSILRKR